jgi:RNA polymerase sigma-70 factor (ECF subfamily)
MAKCFAAQLESPSRLAMKKELLSQVEHAFNNMDPLDREVLALRHFEEMTNDEVAAFLGLQKSAASNRYVRALGRLKEELAGIQGWSSTV